VALAVAALWAAGKQAQDACGVPAALPAEAQLLLLLVVVLVVLLVVVLLLVCLS
jgi:hypothetical protein